jgi:hypothetical protein
MENGSRTSDFVNQIWCVLRVFFLCSWLCYELRLEERLLSGISDNKVGVRSSSVWLVWRAAGQSSQGLFFKSPWWKMKERFCEVGFFNKRTPSVLDEAVRSSLLSHRGGGGRLGIRSVFVFFTSGGYGDTVIAYAFGSESSTASRRSQTGSPPTLTAEGQPLLTCTPSFVTCCKIIFNLQALPIRRLFISGAFGSRCSYPSGNVPGVVVVVRCRRFVEQGGDGAGPGLDGFSCIRSEVLCVICQDIVVILCFSEVLYVICNSTALN